MFPCCWCRLDREGWAGRLGQEGQAEGRQAPRCEWGCRESCGVLLPEPPGTCLGGGGGGGRAADPALAAARPGAGAPLRPQRPGPARPAASEALWPARRGLGRTPKLSPGGVAGRRRGLQGPGPARGVRLRSPRAKARTARRVRGALPRGGPQSWHKTKVRVRGFGGVGGAAAREDTGSQGRPGAAGVRGLRGAQPPLPGRKRRTRGHRAPLRAAAAESRLQRVRGCSRGHTCGAPARKARRSAVRRPDIN